MVIVLETDLLLLAMLLTELS